MELRTEFTDCDDFAGYVIESCLDRGYIVTEESNKVMKTGFQVGKDLANIVLDQTFIQHAVDNGFQNLSKYRSFKSYLYDIYELHYAPKKNIISLHESVVYSDPGIDTQSECMEFAKYLRANFIPNIAGWCKKESWPNGYPYGEVQAFRIWKETNGNAQLLKAIE